MAWIGVGKAVTFWNCEFSQFLSVYEVSGLFPLLSRGLFSGKRTERASEGARFSSFSAEATSELRRTEREEATRERDDDGCGRKVGVVQLLQQTILGRSFPQGGQIEYCAWGKNLF